MTPLSSRRQILNHLPSRMVYTCDVEPVSAKCQWRNRGSCANGEEDFNKGRPWLCLIVYRDTVVANGETEEAVQTAKRILTQDDLGSAS